MVVFLSGRCLGAVMSKDKNDHLRFQLSKSLDELQLLEDNNELILSFSDGICQLMQNNGGAHPLLQEISECKINRETDPFTDHSGCMLIYCSTKIFFKITHHQKTAHIDIGLYNEIDAMRRQRNDYQWYALEAVTNF